MTDLAGQPKKLDRTREYVAGGVGAWGTQRRVLTWAFDDLTQELGDAVYERMLRDAQVAANVNLYKAAVLEDGLNLTSAVSDKDADGYAQAAALVDATERQIADMAVSLDDSLWSLMDAIATGSKVAEEVYAVDQTMTGRAQYVLSALKPKPRRSIAYVVDAFGTVVGLRGSAVVGDDGQTIGYDVLDRDKFCIFSFRPRDGDVRGTSLLRPAYNPYDLKMRSWPEYYRYLVQFASPSVVGTTAEGAPDEPDPDDPSSYVTAVQALLTRLLEFQNGTALALPYGATANLLYSQGDGKAFLEAFSLFDRQITTGILGQTRATMEAQYGSRADSQGAADILATFVRQTRKALARTIRRDVLMDLVSYNAGPQLRRLTPLVSFGETEQVDVAPLMTAVASLARVNYLDPSQLPDLDMQLGLAARTPAELARRAERAATPPQPTQPAPAPGSDPSADSEQEQS